MIGMTLVELAARIAKARVNFNEALVIQGPSHPSTQSELTKYRRLRQDGQLILSDALYK